MILKSVTKTRKNTHLALLGLVYPSYMPGKETKNLVIGMFANCWEK